MRVAILVTGSRKWSDADAIRNALAPIVQRSSDVVVIHGDAPGADKLAGEWAREFSANEVAMPAQWRKHGNAAGAIRNGEMVKVRVTLRECGYECHVLAFPLPGSVGTWDCVAQAKRAAFKPVVHGPEPTL